MAESTYVYRSPGAKEMESIVAKAKRLRSETTFAIIAWVGKRVGRAVARVLTGVSQAAKQSAAEPYAKQSKATAL